MQAPDLYAVLGVEPSAPAEAITSAFRRRVRELRPDTRVDAVTAERFGRVLAAYRTLREPGPRAAYDRERARTSVRPVRRGRVSGTPTAPGPPLRAGPVRWVP
ncbi:J domain-containing protein [Streptomyces sp. S.PNR 29]|uniref:J domain-containing protein n=1 Tax=Streptomyces sp. S.PNR 29 TaxID=2973805 RepID=UPI0025AF4AF4|nr:J domain-containing protein [Streptomyces sp. S.PNR 29]MDN0200472.1 J domain-containing protein [Streptomyces sp. S.PNR 29]